MPAGIHGVPTVARRVEDSGLKDDEGGGDVVLDLNFDRVRQILRHGGHGKQIGGAHEEVPVERRHAQVCKTISIVVIEGSRNTHSSTRGHA